MSREGECVIVQGLQQVEHKGRRTLRACISTSDGKSGWVSCKDQVGHILLDTRDHLEYDKVKKRISQLEIEEDMCFFKRERWEYKEVEQRILQRDIEEDIGLFHRKDQRKQNVMEDANENKTSVGVVEQSYAHRESHEQRDAEEEDRGKVPCRSEVHDLWNAYELEAEDVDSEAEDDSFPHSTEDYSRIGSKKIPDDENLGHAFDRRDPCRTEHNCFTATCGAMVQLPNPCPSDLIPNAGNSSTLIETLLTDGLMVKIICWENEDEDVALDEHGFQDKAGDNSGMTTVIGSLFLSHVRPELILLCEEAEMIIDLRAIEHIALGKDVDELGSEPHGNFPMLDDNCCTLILDDGQMVGFCLSDILSRNHLARVITHLRESAEP
eukprot:gnl/MRDRNA2_/MRDRNA2_79840_c0_seq2.p1 gnl/MRDRNA2_/MRDRNA2_79840_c0~~gnl/MRDRNA2_/MRDRNA2_79840_c0_seq2.p1  ORF type:complete len:381 (-),score=72.59 gnl/MRDRNA2_/MRDRNA2_79840_c0_seq2:38-1180(-)